MHKEIFIEEYEWVDNVEDYKNFFKKLDKLNLYIVEFEKDYTMKSKIYPTNYIIKRDKWQLIIIIIQNKYIFSTNNRI